jgi:hypothetical protein
VGRRRRTVTPGSLAVVGSFGTSKKCGVAEESEDPWLCGPGFRRVCLCRGGEQELRIRTGDVNKASRAKRTLCATVLTASQLQRLAPRLLAVGLGC